MKLPFVLFLTIILATEYSEGCLVLNGQKKTTEFTSTTVDTTTTSGSTIAEIISSSSRSSSDPTFSTSTISEVSSEGTSTDIALDHTTTISTGSTTTGDCQEVCKNQNNILISENTVFGKPEYKIIGSLFGDDVCQNFFLTCKPEEGQTCDNIHLYASQTQNGSLIQLGTPSNTRVDVTVPCTVFGDYLATDGATLIDEIFCMFTNCQVEPTTTETMTTIGENLCSTCQITDTFNYTEPTDKVKPWYYDISTTDCSCKAHAVSCSLYTVNVCDSFAIKYIADDNQLYTLSETTGTLVEGEVECQGNGKFGADGRNIKELFCTHSGCRNTITEAPIPEETD